MFEMVLFGIFNFCDFVLNPLLITLQNHTGLCWGEGRVSTRLSARRAPGPVSETTRSGTKFQVRAFRASEFRGRNAVLVKRGRCKIETVIRMAKSWPPTFFFGMTFKRAYNEYPFLARPAT